MLILVILSHLGNHTISNILLLYIIYSLLYSYFLLFSHVFFFIIISYLFSIFTDTIHKPMKIGCSDEVCSHLNHVLTASSTIDLACSEQLQNLLQTKCSRMRLKINAFSILYNLNILTRTDFPQNLRFFRMDGNNSFWLCFLNHSQNIFTGSMTACV